jgi:hypothetical protein
VNTNKQKFIIIKLYRLNPMTQMFIAGESLFGKTETAQGGGDGMPYCKNYQPDAPTLNCRDGTACPYL